MGDPVRRPGPGDPRQVAGRSGAGRFPSGTGPGRSSRDNGCGCCFDLDAFFRRLEALLLTTRGLRVAASATCQQPVRSYDLDEAAYGISIPAADGISLLLYQVPEGRRATVKAWGVAVTVAPGAKSAADPAIYLRFDLMKNGRPLPPYQARRSTELGGLAMMTAVQVDLGSLDTLEVRAYRVGADTTPWRVSTRFKGWIYTPLAETPGAAGAFAF